MPRTWLAPQLDPAAIAKDQGKPNTDEPPAIALARLGTVSARFPAASACAPSKPVSCQGGHLGAASEGREPGLEKVPRFSGAELVRSEERREGREGEGRKPGCRGDQRQRV